MLAVRHEKITEERNIIAGEKLGADKFKLYSLRYFGDLAMIDKHDYYIDVQLEGQNTTSLNYRIRGNQTYLVIGVAFGLILLVPNLLWIGSLRQETEEEGIFIMILGVFLLAGVLNFFLLRSATAYERKAERILQYLIKKIESEN